MNAWRRCLLWMEGGGDTGEAAPRLCAEQHRHAGWRLVGEGGFDQTGTGLRCLEGRDIFSVPQKADLLRTGRFQRGDVADPPAGTGGIGQRRFGDLRQLRESLGRRCEEESRIGHGLRILIAAGSAAISQ